MKHIFLNLKRFDVPVEKGGINRLYDINSWGSDIVKAVQNGLKKYDDTQFAIFLPEAHLLGAKSALKPGGNLAIGCQSIHFDDITPGGNFGAFTSSRPAAAASSLGCDWVMIGHCEERNKLKAILTEGSGDLSAVNMILQKKVQNAAKTGLKILFCVGETEAEQPTKEEVLKSQLQAIDGIDNIVIAYEPVWAIGPGKTPPDAEYIRDISGYIKSLVNLPVVYGGGLKEENAPMLAGIESINGGLVALTRFSGEIGFYPDEFLTIVEKYLEG